jgi:hypothetical protein
MPRKPVNPAHAYLVEQWKETYDEFSAHGLSEETDYENFCWGWCMAKGLTTDEAYEFYQAMVALGTGYF